MLAAAAIYLAEVDAYPPWWVRSLFRPFRIASENYIIEGG